MFKFLFGNPEHKDWTLGLYNAVNGSSYDKPDDIEFNTIDDAVYLGMRNDVSFIILNEINLWEHQSNVNPNMPMRFLIYIGMVYSKFIENSDNYNPYSSTLQKAPTPKCVCFYNGISEKGDRKVISLSSAFDGEGDVEVKVLMININYGHNNELLQACKPLNEYSWFVSKIREYQKAMNSLEDAVDAAIDEMNDDFVIKSFLLDNKAEVKRMCITEYDEQKTMAAFGREAAHKQAVQGAIRMIKAGKLTLDEIANYQDLPLEEVIALSDQIKAVPV